ncbi:MAG: hypothetical protein ACO1Q7_14030 [Gemmatimonas sp.]
MLALVLAHALEASARIRSGSLRILHDAQAARPAKVTIPASSAAEAAPIQPLERSSDGLPKADESVSRKEEPKGKSELAENCCIDKYSMTVWGITGLSETITLVFATSQFPCLLFFA